MTFFGLTSGYLIGVAVWCVLLFVGMWLLLKLRRSGQQKPVRKRLANVGLSLWLLCVMLTMVEVGFAIGYGIGATTLQMAAVYAILANDGEWVEPHVVSEIVSPDGESIVSEARRREAISPETAATMRSMVATTSAEVSGAPS